MSYAIDGKHRDNISQITFEYSAPLDTRNISQSTSKFTDGSKKNMPTVEGVSDISPQFGKKTTQDFKENRLSSEGV